MDAEPSEKAVAVATDLAPKQHEGPVQRLWVREAARRIQANAIAPETARLRKAVRDLAIAAGCVTRDWRNENPMEDAVQACSEALTAHAPLIAECHKTEKEG